MKVKIKMGSTLAASPAGILNPGKVVLVDSKLADELVKAGYAELIRSKKIETATVKPKEKTINVKLEKRSKKGSKAVK